MSTAQLLPNVVQKFFDSNGLPLAAGKLYSYQAGTVTPLVTYNSQTVSVGTQNTNPVILDSTGSAPVWLGPNAYKLVLKDSSNVVQWTVDNVSNVNIDSIDKTKINSDICGQALAQAGGGEIDVQVDSSTIEISSNALRVKDLGITAAKINRDAMVEVVFKNQFDTTGYGIHAVPQYPWSSPTLLSDPSTLPYPSTGVPCWSPKGEFLAISSFDSTVPLTIYQRTGDVLTKLPDPASPPLSEGNGAAWSPDGQFLVVATRFTPFIYIYQRSGTTFTKLSNPGTIPSAIAGKPVFSPNGEFLVLYQGSGYHLYKVNGTTFTHLSTGASTTCGAVLGIAWSPDSQFLGFCGTSTPYVNIMQRVDETFTLLPDPGTLPVNACTGLNWSPDGQFLAMGEGSTPFLIIYQQSGSTFTKLADPLSLPPDAGNHCSWSPNSLYLTVSTTTTPFFTTYSVSGTTFTKLSNPGVLSTGNGTASAWSPDGKYLAMAISSSPYIQIYKTASTLATNAFLWVRNILNV